MFFRYPGGRNKLNVHVVDKIIHFFIDNGYNYQYREPFFGVGSVGLKVFGAVPLLKNIWINDFDVGISSIWSAVINSPDELVKRVNGFSPSVNNFFEFKEDLLYLDRNRYDTIDTAFKKIVIHQISFSGLGTMAGGPLGGKDQKIYKIDSRWNPEKIVKKIRELNSLLESRDIYHNKCDSFDFEELLVSGEKYFLYLEPPYHKNGPHLYQHHFSKRDHYRLCNLLKNISNPWLLLYDDCSFIRKLYSWAEFIKEDIDYRIDHSKTKTELLITSKKYGDFLRDEGDMGMDIFS